MSTLETIITYLFISPWMVFIKRMWSVFGKLFEELEPKSPCTNYPNYVRILNFGSKKTGWLTHMPFKINVNILGEITPFYQPLKVPEMQ